MSLIGKNLRKIDSMNCKIKEKMKKNEKYAFQPILSLLRLKSTAHVLRSTGILPFARAMRVSDLNQTNQTNLIRL